MTKRELQEYIWLRKNIQQLEDELLRLETEATRQTTSLRQEPRGNNYDKDKLTSVVAKIIAVKDHINEQLQRSYELQAKIEQAIAGLPQREGYLVRLRYLELKNWDTVCADMGFSWQYVHRIHSRLLKKFA